LKIEETQNLIIHEMLNIRAQFLLIHATYKCKVPFSTNGLQDFLPKSPIHSKHVAITKSPCKSLN